MSSSICFISHTQPLVIVPTHAALGNLAGQFLSLYYLPGFVCWSHSCSQQSYKVFEVVFTLPSTAELDGAWSLHAMQWKTALP